MQKLVYLFPLFLILTACDNSSVYNYRIENKSDSTLYFKYSQTYNDTIKHKKIYPQNSFLIDRYETTNGFYDLDDKFLTKSLDTVECTLDSSYRVKIKKDYKKRENWAYEFKNGTGLWTKSGEGTYTLILKNEDLK